MSLTPTIYRRLVVTRPNGVRESFDLRHHPSLTAGEDDSNDVALTSTLVPFDFKILKTRWFGKTLELRLTDDVLGTLKGDVVIVRDWKTRLYTGKTFEIRGDVEWMIGDVHFRVESVATVALEGLRSRMPDDEKRDFRRATGYSLALFAILFVMITTATFIRGLWTAKPDEVMVQKVSLQTAKNVFKAPAPPVIEVEPKIDKAVDVPKQVTKKTEPQKSTARAANKASKNVRSASGKTRGLQPRNVKNLGLLAIQTTPGASRVSIAVAAPKVVSHQVADASREPMLGLGKATSGIGLSEGDPSSVAKLGSLSGKSYDGGLGTELVSARTPSIALVRKEVEVRGALDPAVIRQIIEERLSEIRYCYENALLKQTGLSGKIAASWTIQSDGSVSQVASDSNDIEQKLLHPCVRSQIAQWKFPSPKGGGIVKVKYPFLFNPVGGMN